MKLISSVPNSGDSLDESQARQKAVFMYTAFCLSLSNQGHIPTNYIDSDKGYDGNAMAKGMSAANGFMRIVLDENDAGGKTLDTLKKSIEGYPGEDEILVNMSDAYVSFASGEDANGSDSSQNVPEGLASDRDDHYDSLQGEVDQYFNEAVERA